MAAIFGLPVHLWVEINIMDNNSVCTNQIEALATRTS
jgi:hypothetical protein